MATFPCVWGGQNDLGDLGEWIDAEGRPPPPHGFRLSSATCKLCGFRQVI